MENTNLLLVRLISFERDFIGVKPIVRAGGEIPSRQRSRRRQRHRRRRRRSQARQRRRHAFKTK